jgi:hypothetical protein
MTLSDLMAIHDVISQREADDIAKLTSLSSPNEAQLKVAKSGMNENPVARKLQIGNVLFQ